DALLGHFGATEKVFQMHGDTFDLPSGAVHLAESKACRAQAFRFGEKAYGLQFHLEVDKGMIARFLHEAENRREVEEFGGIEAIAQMERDTGECLPRSSELSAETFRRFIQLFGLQERSRLTRSGHGKPKR
ncbi:MAG: type 1 glutamine amidotransferase, partial [Bdellovibrionota bacterium]